MTRLAPICPNCNAPMVSRQSGYKRGRIWWRCSPCDVSCHQDAQTGQIIGTPAGRVLRGLRRTAHGLLVVTFESKRKAYQWLEDHSSTGHIGTLPEDELRWVIRKLQKRLDRQNGLHPPSSPREGGFFPRGRPADFPQRAVGLPSMPKAPGAGSTAQGLLTEGPAPGRSAVGLPANRSGASPAITGKPSTEVPEDGGAAKPPPRENSRPQNSARSFMAAGVSERGGPVCAAAGCSTGRSSLGMR